MTIKKRIHLLLEKIVSILYRLLCRMHLCEPKVVVYIDGGICSQIHQFLQGQIYALRGENVFYDLSWFERDGKDVDGNFSRLFELNIMYPELSIPQLGRFEAWFYSKFLMYRSVDHKLPGLDTETPIAPCYLREYTGIPANMYEALFTKCIASQPLIASTLDLSFEAGQHTCAVHVRRGDLASGDNPYYGGVTNQYFVNATNYVEREYPNTKFFFFSDETDYVKETLLPLLAVRNIEVIDVPHKAYEDLLLISSCDDIIASQGSFGKFAAMLNPASRLIMQRDPIDGPRDVHAKSWCEKKKNSLLIEG